MEDNLNEAERGVEKSENRTQTGHNKPLRLAKTSVDYWKTKVRPRIVRGSPTAELYVRFFEASGEAWVCLDTPNRLNAAAKARDYWVKMKAIGLPALLAEISPDQRPSKMATVTEAIEAASRLTTVRLASFSGYAKRLRQIAGEISRIKRPKQYLSRSHPAAIAWKESVGAVRIDVFTSEAVNKWRAERVADSKGDPQHRRKATVSADAVIRLARAVFSKENLAAGLGKEIRLPDPLPFTGVSYGKSYKRFIPSVDATQLFAAARTELANDFPQQFLAFCLCLLAGLRKSEADSLTWDQVDLDNAVIRIRSTPYMEPKSEEASREIEIDVLAVEILRRAKRQGADPIFVLKGGAHRPQVSTFKTYRANAAPHFTWDALITWLRGKGIADEMPVHVLRKLAGSIVFQAHGVEQAREFLGHGDVSTTSRSYIAKTKRVVVSLTPRAEVSKARELVKEAAR